MEEKIKAKLDELRVGLQADGGDLELVKIDGKVVYLKLVGHCGSCPFAMMTLKQGIEAGLQEIDPEITVERVVEEPFDSQRHGFVLRSVTGPKRPPAWLSRSKGRWCAS